jgi:hypothetical protein
MAARAALFNPPRGELMRRPFDDDKYRVEDTRKTGPKSSGGKQ